MIFKLLKFLKPFWKHFGFVLALIFASQAFGLITPYFFAKIFDASELSTALFYVGGSFAIWLVVASLISTIRSRCEVKYINFDTDVHLGNASLGKLLGLSIGQHRNQHSGVKQHVISQGESSIDQIVTMLMFDIVPIVVQVLTTLVLIFIVSPLVGLWVSTLTLLFIIISLRRNILYRPRILKWLDKDKENSKIVSEIYRNAPFVILEAQEKKALEFMRNSHLETNSMAKKIWFPFVTESGLIRIILGLARFGGIAIAIYLVFNGSFSKGMIFAFVSWIQQALGNVENLAHHQRRLMMMMGKTRKYFDLLEMKTDVVESENPITVDKIKGKIEFKDVSYSYPERKDDPTQKISSKDSLKNLSFVINPGEKIGIVGESGAGKSTLVNLLRRSFDPKYGQILIDDVPLTDINLSSYRRQLGNVEQDVAVFDLSIKENILFGMNGSAKYVTDEQLAKATKMASINDFIETLENGFDTVVGERGIRLSGGERQRIAIARALVKDPNILIFDEATSSLDSYHEKLVHDAMNEASVGRTTIIIAHRLSTVIDADRIIVLKDGKINDIGTNDELKERCSEYQKLIKNQVVMF